MIVVPLVTFGLLTGPFAMSAPVDDGCPEITTPARGAGPGCQEAVPQPPAIAFADAEPEPEAASGTESDGEALVDDPTTTGKITRRMLHAHDEVNRVFTDWPWSITCWDAHEWNPTSDHPRGRACDFTAGRLGRLPTARQRTTGWQLARWAQVNADRLGIRYIIWDGQIWSQSRFRGGWRTYNGGGVYDPTSPTGGHYDHVHISVVG